jgi:GPI inositol-deacylase, winged helix domain
MSKACKCYQCRLPPCLVFDNTARFLLARLHMDSLVGKHTPAAVRRALENLPKEVDDTYDEAIERIKRQNQDDRELAEQVFSWITYARRPLSAKELQHALAVVPATTHIDPDAIIDEEILTSVCAGLVVIDEERSIIRLVRK